MFRSRNNLPRGSTSSPDVRGPIWERLHRSDDGLLTFATSIAVLTFALLGALVLNVGQSVRQKIEVQNSADAAAQSAAATMARGMNAVTAVNHLLGELTALCVMHEALGGPELDEGRTMPSLKSIEMNLKLTKALPAAMTAVAPFAYLGQLDTPATTLLISDAGQHTAWATIYDARMTLKFHLSLCLTLRPVATALLIIPGAGPTLALSLHVAIAAVVAKIYVETHLLNLIEVVATGFSPAKLALEASVLPMLAGFAEQAVKETPRAAAGIVREVGSRNGVTTFLYPEEPQLPLEKREFDGGTDLGGGGALGGLGGIGGAVGGAIGGIGGGLGGQEPPAGDADAGPLDPAFAGLKKVHKVVSDAVDVIQDAVSWNPLLSAIADEVLDINVPALDMAGGPGNDGWDDNLSRKNLPRLSQKDWDEIRYSQWMRATYPYIRAWRVPVRESLTGTQTFSWATKWYSRWTNRYALVKIRKYHQGEYGGGKGQEKLAMYVMIDSADDKKGRERWTTDDAYAEQKFTLVAFAHRTPPAPTGTSIFGGGPVGGITAYAQSIYYNGNDQRPDGWSKSSDFQPTVGWDTLNWQSPSSAGRAYEFIHGDDNGLSVIPPRFPFMFINDPPGDDPVVALNWHAKLTPVTRLEESWSKTPPSMRGPLDKMHRNHGIFRSH